MSRLPSFSTSSSQPWLHLWITQEWWPKVPWSYKTEKQNKTQTNEGNSVQVWCTESGPGPEGLNFFNSSQIIPLCRRVKILLVEVIQHWAYSLPSNHTPGESSACSHTKDFWEPGNRVPQPRECNLVFEGKGGEKRGGGAKVRRRLAVEVLPAPWIWRHTAGSSPQGLVLLRLRGRDVSGLTTLTFFLACVGVGRTKLWGMLETRELWYWDLGKDYNPQAAKGRFENEVTSMLKRLGYNNKYDFTCRL